MNIYYSLKTFPALNKPIALTIGNFDGVHLGHQAVLKALTQKNAHSVVLTFSNHPCEVLLDQSVSFLTTLSHRLELLKQMQVESTLLIPFTKEFSNQTAEAFLTTLKQKVPFSHLILGHDALIGCDRLSNLEVLSAQLKFSIEYLHPTTVNHEIVSSSYIRQNIQAGNLQEASQLLGRPYSIAANVEAGKKIGRGLGFHTANLPVQNLVHPPFGVYAVQVSFQNQIFPAVANLGYAPTLHTDRQPSLEVHLFDTDLDLYEKQIEVRFVQFLRSEKKFTTPQALKAQIIKDISSAKQALINK